MRYVNFTGVCCSSYGYNIVVALSAYSCKVEIHGELGKNGLEGECQGVIKFFSPCSWVWSAILQSSITGSALHKIYSCALLSLYVVFIMFDMSHSCSSFSPLFLICCSYGEQIVLLTLIACFYVHRSPLSPCLDENLLSRWKQHNFL